MPGRYSHSVVLAGYSSQGIISLPSNQHLEYFKHSPYAASTQPRGKADGRLSLSDPRQRSQSAMTARSGRWTPASLERKSPTRRIYIDTDDDLVASQSTRQQPRRPLSTTPALQRKSLNDRNLDRNPASTTTSTSGLNPSNGNAPRLPLRLENRNEVSHEVSHRGQPLRLTSSPDATPAPSVRLTVLHRKAASPEPLHGDRFDRSVPVSTQGYVHQMLNDGTRRGYLHHPHPHQPGATAQAQVPNQFHEESEPNFDDFSDGEDSSTSYFAPRSSTPTTSYPPRQDLPSQERAADTSSPISIMTRSRQSFHNYTPASSLRSERNDTANSDDSTGILHSKSSISSIGSSVGQAPARTMKLVDTKKANTQAPIAAWGLPEIEEDAVFDPELFAQDLTDDLDGPDSGHSPFGMISSGRDVDFFVDNDDDAASESASACPPDINRYRDEDDDAPAPLKMRLTSITGRAPSPATFSTKSKKGFLARLTSKRNWV